MIQNGRRQRGRLARAALEEREETLRGLCFCLLHDLSAWLARNRHPVPHDLREYRLERARGLADPGTRLRQYIEPALVEHWEQALDPFFRSGASVSIELGEVAPLEVKGLEHGDREVRAEIRFSERSSLVDAAGRRHPLPQRSWILEARVSPELTLVENAWLRPV